MRRTSRIITVGLLSLLAGSAANADATDGAASGALQRAVAEFQRAEYAQALQHLSRLPPSPERDYYSGLSELKLGNTQQAVEYLQQVTVDQPGNAHAFYALAAVHFERLEEVGALRKFAAFRSFRRNLENALALQPEHLGANGVYVLFLLEAPRFLGESKRQVDARIDRIAELNRAYAEYLWGYRAQKTGDLAAAERHFKEAVALQPLPRATYALARLYLDAGRYDQAIARALELAASEVRWDDPSRSDGHRLAARAHLGKGQVTQARRHFRQALVLCPAAKTCSELQAEFAATRG